MDQGESNLPKWLKELDDGSVTVSFEDLKRKPLIDGNEVSQIEMREPSVGDQLTMQKKHKDTGDAEVALIANLTENAPEIINSLTVKQYNRLATALAFFQSG